MNVGIVQARKEVIYTRERKCEGGENREVRAAMAQVERDVGSITWKAIIVEPEAPDRDVDNRQQRLEDIEALDHPTFTEATQAAGLRDSIRSEMERRLKRDKRADEILDAMEKIYGGSIGVKIRALRAEGGRTQTAKAKDAVQQVIAGWGGDVHAVERDILQEFNSLGMAKDITHQRTLIARMQHLMQERLELQPTEQERQAFRMDRAVAKQLRYDILARLSETTSNAAARKYIEAVDTNAPDFLGYAHMLQEWEQQVGQQVVPFDMRAPAREQMSIALTVKQAQGEEQQGTAYVATGGGGNQCYAFQRGHCTFGDRCKFSHDDEGGSGSSRRAGAIGDNRGAAGDFLRSRGTDSSRRDDRKGYGGGWQQDRERDRGRRGDDNRGGHHQRSRGADRSENTDGGRSYGRREQGDRERDGGRREDRSRSRDRSTDRRGQDRYGNRGQDTDARQGTTTRKPAGGGERSRSHSRTPSPEAKGAGSQAAGARHKAAGTPAKGGRYRDA
jgi:hypothetical protein